MLLRTIIAGDIHIVITSVRTAAMATCTINAFIAVPLMLLTRCGLLYCSVRFGLVGGKMRLLVAGQSGGIYIFEIGPGPLDSASKGTPCQEVIANQEEEEGVEEVRQRLLSNHREVWLQACFWTLDVVFTTCHQCHVFSVL